MSSTSYRFADFEARTNRAVDVNMPDGRYEPLYTRDPAPEAPAGGASSSINDMSRWLAMVLANGTYEGKQIVDPKALLPAITPQIVSSPASEPAMRSGFYGYGFNVSSTSAGRMELSHSGAFELGAGTNFVILPSADVAIIALTNGTASGVPEALNAQFADLVQFGEVREKWFELYQSLLAPDEKPVGALVGQKPPANPAPSAPLSSYVGTYNNDYWGPARVSQKDGNLHLELVSKFSVPLINWDGNVFTYEWVSENSPPGSIGKATFDADELTLEYYDELGKGTFTR
jgi:CubicO group peptidase (beta-lactamase class C family)